MSEKRLLIKPAVRLLRLPYGICIFSEPPSSICKLRHAYSSLRLRGLCTVGDVVTNNVVRFWRVPDVAVIDYTTRGGESVCSDIEPLFDVVMNLVHERSSLTPEIEHVLLNSRRLATQGKRVLVKVRGEEDLLAIPAVLILDGFLVVYGNYFLNCLVCIPSSTEYRKAVLKLYVQFR